MPKFHIIHVQAVWERACFEVEAEDREDAIDKLHDLNGKMELIWKEITGAVESVDSEIESVEEVADDGSAD